MKYAVAAFVAKNKYGIEIPDLKHKSMTQFVVDSDKPIEVLRATARWRLLDSLQKYIDERELVPEPTVTPKELNKLRGPDYKARWVVLAPHHALKIQAYNCWRHSKLTETRLARLVGMSRAGIRNLFKLDVLSQMDNIVTIIEACGYRLQMQVVPAGDTA